MTFEQIKNLKPEDFETRNEEVWDSINKLSLEEVENLMTVFFDQEIQESLSEIFHEKVFNLLGSIINISKLTDYQKKNLAWFASYFKEETAQAIYQKLTNTVDLTNKNQ